MSPENVEVVRRAYAGWSRGAYLPQELWAENLEWHASPDDPDTAAIRGRAEAGAVLHDWLDHLGRFNAELEFTDAGDEVLVCVRVLLIGATAPLLAYHLCGVENGMVCRVRAYSERGQALEAVGSRH